MPAIVTNGAAINTASGTSVTATFPSSHTATAGNLLLACHVCATSAAVTTPTNWTLIYGPVTTNSTLTLNVYVKEAVGGETGVSITGPNTRVNVIVAEVDDCDAADIVSGAVDLFEGTSEQTGTGTSGPLATASINPTSTDDCLFFAFFGFGSGVPGAASWSNSFTELFAATDGGAACRMNASTRTINNPGATSTECDWTNNSSARSVILAVPASAAGPVAHSETFTDEIGLTDPEPVQTIIYTDEDPVGLTDAVSAELIRVEPSGSTLVGLVEGHLLIEAGLDLLDSDDVFIEDISQHLSSGVVKRSNFATIHGTCELRLAKKLQWGSQRLRPWVTLTSAADGTWKRWNLGVYIPSIPTRDVGETPETFNVHCYDKLLVLDRPYGASYQADAGETVLDLIETLISDAGEAKVLLDPEKSSAVLANAFERPFDPQTTRLHIINDLLALIGYRGLWVDRDGYYRSGPYQSASERSPMWTYDADGDESTVGRERQEDADYTDAPNRWIFYRDHPAGDLAETGDGLYEVVNQSDGPTSIDQRGGMVITRIHPLDAVDQTSLELQAARIVDNDKRLARAFRLTVGPNPEHWHFDVITYKDAQIPFNGKCQVGSWTLPLTGEDGTLEVKEV